ncbi:hypothetical protein K3555_13670 [Leisingera sp. M527]|nr:hypothetical protein [Leisingera sp. M527]UWQ31641.1 hypothetical protein K3555_13670 [Leisingera sp. M527]
MIQSSYDVTPEELFRLLLAYTAIRKPETRTEILTAVEKLTMDQWMNEGR